MKNGRVEDDAQHVVGDAVDAEVAARAAGECTGEHLGDRRSGYTPCARRREGSRPAARRRTPWGRWSDWPAPSRMQPSGTFAPLLKATLILPSAIVQVEMSTMIGGPFLTGTPAAIGLAESLRWVPPKGATRMPPPLVLTKCSETLPARGRHLGPVADAAQMARVPERHHGHALAPRLCRCPASSPLRPSPGRSRTGRRPPRSRHSQTRRSASLVRQHLARAQPVDVRLGRE